MQLPPLPAETFLFQALQRLQEEYHVPLEEIQNSIQSSYSMLTEYNKMRGTARVCRECGQINEAFPLTFEATKDWDIKGFAWDAEVDRLLRDVFGHSAFRSNQRKVINCVLSRRDAFVIMPTGAGKSLLYQLPGLVEDGITMVISPLISLIQDQISSLRRKGIMAVELTSVFAPKEIMQMLTTLADDRSVKFVFVTPERVVKSTKFLKFLRQIEQKGRLKRIVIDECHCISQWGYDFRPDFKQLSILKTELPKVPILALTSSATNRCKVDIMRQLGLEECDFFTQSFNRPNLRYAVVPKTKKITKKIIAFIKKRHSAESGIIYCLTKKECESMATELKEANIDARFYHAGLSPQKREKVQQKWMTGRFHVMVATIAFGLGIDKPNVRFVIHHSLPRTMEEYYQESGRAGRDGQEADCVVFYRLTDRLRHLFMQLSSCKNTFQARTKLEKMKQLISWCEDNSRCRRQLLLEYFGEGFKGSCNGMCDNCLYGGRAEIKDFTKQAKQILEIVSALGEKASMVDVVAVLRGRVTKKVKSNEWNKLPQFAADTFISELEARRLVQWLALNNYLQEQPTLSAYKTAIVKLSTGDEAESLVSGHAKVELSHYTVNYVDEVLSKGKKRKAPEEPSGCDDDDSDSDQVEVAKVLDKRRRRGKTEYLLKWKSWDESHNCWVPASECHCDELIEKFESKTTQRKRKATKDKRKEKLNESDIEAEPGQEDDSEDEGECSPRRKRRRSLSASPEHEGNNAGDESRILEDSDDDEREEESTLELDDIPSITALSTNAISTPQSMTSSSSSSTASAFDTFLQMPLNCTIKRKDGPGGKAPGFTCSGCAKTQVTKPLNQSSAVTKFMSGSGGKGCMIDIVFSFDTTGSMSAYLEEVKTKVQTLVSELLRDVPDIRIAVIAHGDYCDADLVSADGSPRSYVIRQLDFTNDTAQLCSFIRGTKKTWGGGDGGECYELALYHSRHLSWRANSARALVVIGDDLAHTSDFYGNDMHLDWKNELQCLKAIGVKVYGVHVLSIRFTHSHAAEIKEFYRTLASETGGEYLTLNDFSKIHDTMVSILYREAGDHQFENWVKANGGAAASSDEAPHVYLTNSMKELSFTTEQLLSVHNAIHDKAIDHVNVLSKRYPVTVGKAGCRYVRIEGITFVEQNKNKATQYARMAMKGKKITWVVKCGEWGLIVDNEVVK